MTVSELPADVEDRLKSLVGGLDESWRAALEVDSEFLATYVDMVQVPGKHTYLDDKTRALVMLAVTSAVTTLDTAGIRTAATQAVRAGVTRKEALEAVHLASVLGIHTYVIAVPAVDEVVRAHGGRLIPDTPLTERQLQIRENFRSSRGYWSEMNETLLRVDPEWFTAYTAYSSHPWIHGTLSAKVRELIYIAIDLSTTHLFDTGVRPHVDNALRYGATVEEIIEVLALTASIGIASVRVAAPIIRDVFAAAADLS